MANALVTLCSGKNSGLNEVDVNSLEVDFQRTFGKLDSALPDFDKINDAAYWNYQRSKVYTRANKLIRRTEQNLRFMNKRTTVEREIAVADKPEACPNVVQRGFGCIASGTTWSMT